MDAKRVLDEIFDAERALRKAEKKLLDAPPDALRRLLPQAVRDAKSAIDRSDAELRLVRLADLCAQVPGPEMADALMTILDDESAAVRTMAGEALLDIAYQRYAEVARAIERAVAGGVGSDALEEIPWILAEIGEPSASPLIQHFLAHADPQVVASAIDALAELGDPSAVPALKRLLDDPRSATIEDVGESVVAPISGLAQEAIDALEEGGDDLRN